MAKITEMWDLDENERPILVLTKEDGKLNLEEVQDFLWYKGNGSYRGDYIMVIAPSENGNADSDQWILYPKEPGGSCPVCGGQVDYYDQ